MARLRDAMQRTPPKGKKDKKNELSLRRGPGQIIAVAASLGVEGGGNARDWQRTDLRLLLLLLLFSVH